MATLLGPRATPAPAHFDPVPFVDAALTYASARRVFVHGDAVALLQDVRAALPEDGRWSAVTPIVDAALASYGDDALIGRRRLVDPLLDIRLALRT